MKRCMALVAVLSITVFLFTINAVSAASLSDLSKIKINVTTETQVRDLLGEPKNVNQPLKQRKSGREFIERKDLIYELDGKAVIIRINPANGHVVKIIE